ncbi:DinB family protein [Aquihabitans daechungensis]|uniref:DinB family protein n=1 Tax=Aquihabitans daechungensis TaxID=1052257 RepID=UPI003BA33444
MPDQKPPWLASDERSTLLALLQCQRESMVRKVHGLTDEEAARSPVVTGTSLIWLVRHLAWAEQLWLLQRFAGRTLDPADLSSDDGTLADAVAAYRRTWALVGAVIDDADLEDPCADPAATVNLRWVLAHLLEETARHAGHADILRELIDDQTGR